MATRLYGINPQDASFQATEGVGSATASKKIEVTIDFGALAAAGLSATQAKMHVINGLQRLGEYIEQRGIWPPA